MSLNRTYTYSNRYRCWCKNDNTDQHSDRCWNIIVKLQYILNRKGNEKITFIMHRVVKKKMKNNIV